MGIFNFNCEFQLDRGAYFYSPRPSARRQFTTACCLFVPLEICIYCTLCFASPSVCSVVQLHRFEEIHWSSENDKKFCCKIYFWGSVAQIRQKLKYRTSSHSIGQLAYCVLLFCFLLCSTHKCGKIWVYRVRLANGGCEREHCCLGRMWQKADFLERRQYSFSSPVCCVGECCRQWSDLCFVSLEIVGNNRLAVEFTLYSRNCFVWEDVKWTMSLLCVVANTSLSS